IIYPNINNYIELVKSSPIIHKWSDRIEEYFIKELIEIENGYKCHIPLYVMEEELKEMGGSIRKINILKNFLNSPVNFIRKIIKNKNFDFE
ncbi:MAG: alpha/beta hydrolase, partial [Leptospiraceae bacterium]|nr:alpha/beta hydrolase [Leptospiraceae bacterium]